MPKHMIRPMPKRGTTRIQFQTADGRGGAKLTVPAHIARQVGTEALFAVELTEDGILYRHVDGEVASPYPAWLTNGERHA